MPAGSVITRLTSPRRSLGLGLLAAWCLIGGSVRLAGAWQWHQQTPIGSGVTSTAARRGPQTGGVSSDSAPAFLLPIEGLGPKVSKPVPASSESPEVRGDNDTSVSSAATKQRSSSYDTASSEAKAGNTNKIPALNIGFPQESLPPTLQQKDSESSEGVVRLLKPLNVEARKQEVLTQRYPNGKLQVERTVVQDEFGNYLNHGKWKMYHTDGQLMGIGRFEKGQMVGVWKRLHFDRNHPWFQTSDFQEFQLPFLSTAEFSDGEMNGLWTIKDALERNIFQLEYREGRRNGTGTWWYPNGQMRRQLQCKRDRLDGQWLEWDDTGKQTRENWFVEGRRVTRNVSYFRENHPETEQTYLEPRLELAVADDWWNARLGTYEPTGEITQEGPVRAWYDNGQKHMAGYFKQGTKHGEFAWWHPNGNRKLLGSYRDGLRDGRWTWWHENGIKAAEVTFQDDHASSELLTWDENGIRTEGTTPENGRRQSTAKPSLDSEDLPEPESRLELEADPIPLSTEDLEELPPEGPSLTRPGSGEIDPVEPEQTSDESQTPEEGKAETTDPDSLQLQETSLDNAEEMPLPTTLPPPRPAG